MSEEHKNTVRRFIEKAWNQGDMAAWDGFFAAGFVYHDPASPSVHTLEEYRAFICNIPAISSDIRYTIDDMIAEEDKVVFRYSCRGTVAKNGKKFSHIGIGICCFAGEKIAEIWDVYDALGIQRQLAGG